MSTFKEIIARVNEMKPNAFSQRTKLSWLTSLNGKLAADIFLMNIAEIRSLPQGDMALECEPLVGFPHEEIYEEYLIAKIDAANGEAREYQNRIQLYDSYYGNFVAWFKSTYDPVQGDPACHGLRPKLPTYYITAYGMAVMCGYQGTIQQWLASLKGEPGVSPSISVVEIPGGHQVTVTSAGSAETFNVMNGNGAVSSVNGVLPMGNGNVVLAAENVGARADDWMPTAEEVGARADDWMPTTEEIEKLGATAAAAKKLETARSIQVNLGSENCQDFDGSMDIQPGVRGTLPITHGGHGATDAAGARKNLGAQAQNKSVMIVLPASGWVDLTQTVAVGGVTEDNDVDVMPAPVSHTVYCETGIYCTTQENGSLTFTCEDIPTENVTVNIRIWD